MTALVLALVYEVSSVTWWERPAGSAYNSICRHITLPPLSEGVLAESSGTTLMIVLGLQKISEIRLLKNTSTSTKVNVHKRIKLVIDRWVVCIRWLVLRIESWFIALASLIKFSGVTK